MLGGVQITQRAQAHALEMLNAAAVTSTVAAAAAPTPSTSPVADPAAERRRQTRAGRVKNAGS